MEAEDFSGLEVLFHEVLNRPPDDREAFLASRCDEATARRVIELVRAFETAPGFLNEPLVRSFAALESADVPPGTRIGDYEIKALLGAGGMGHVYRARDINLGRDVAIKVVGGSVWPESDDRLLAEARHIARLSHPNICTVFQVVQYEGHPCLIMELVEGLTLEQRLGDRCHTPRRCGTPCRSLMRSRTRTTLVSFTAT
jgi:serine/threonine protein kinase